MGVTCHRPAVRPRRIVPSVPSLTASIAALVFTAGACAAPAPQAHVLSPGASGARAVPAANAARAAAIGDASLLRALGRGEQRDYYIELGTQADLSAAYTMNWLERGRYVHRTLVQHAERTQAGLRQALAAQGAQFQPFWIANGIVVKHGDLAGLLRVAGFGEVARIRVLPRVAPVDPVQKKAAGPTPAAGVTDNLRQIGADQVWAQGTTGSGVTVGIIDSGVLPEHEALRQQYRGYRGGALDHDYNWLGPEGHPPAPYITSEHGSHVAGIVLGDNRNADPGKRERVGVAPGAQWIACTALGTELGAPEYMLECMQFMLAPTRTDGSAADPDRRPEVVNNSWMTGDTCDGQADPTHQPAIAAWAAAGVVPVFATGNTSNCGLPPTPGLSTVAAPGSLAESFTVGSTGNHDGQYASHSLWGPTVAVSAGLPALPDPRGYAQLKPQVVAPGVAIRSVNVGADPYMTMTGTSMSAPHVAGAFALMIEAGECLRGDYARLGTILMQTAKAVPYDSGGSPAPGPGNVPNYATGWGEIDTVAAVNAAANACGPQGFVRGVVKGADGRTVAGAVVEISTSAGEVARVISDVDGSYVRRLPELTGSGYTVRISAYGYLPSSEGGIHVVDDQTTRHDVTLATATMHKISGRVTDGATGWPLHARIAIAGYPGEPIWTDAQTGFYAIRLPEGTAFRFDLTSDVPGYKPASRDVPDASAITQDFTLAADPIACAAPGYRYANQPLTETFESNGAAAPAGWTATSAGIGWVFGTSVDASSMNYVIPEHGRFAASNDELGPGGGENNDGSLDYLTLPALNLSGLVQPVLRYDYVYPGGGIGGATVEGSVDGGTTWTPLARVAGTDYMVRWTDAVIDLAPVAQNGARIRFHVDDGSQLFPATGPAFALDNVAVRAGCMPPANGGLVTGRVRDANSGVALDGALVNVGGGATVRTATSADPAIGAGYYVAWAAPGNAAVTASRGTLPAGYADGNATASVTNAAVATADVALPAGRLRLYPSGGPTANVVMGSTASVSFTVANSGTAPLAFALERTGVEEHFEESFPPQGWSVVNHGASACGWGALPPQLGNYAGGNGDAAGIYAFECFESTDLIDSSLVSPTFDLSTSNSASIGFFVSLLDGAYALPRLDVDVSTDGGTSWTTAWSLTHDESGVGPGTLVEIDLTPYVGSATTRVRLRHRQMPPWGWVVVDQIHVFDGLSMSPVVDVAPEHGTLAAGASRELVATFDGTRYSQPGTYVESIRVGENTPYEWPFDGSVNATVNVTAPASHGWFAGTVRGLGECDIRPTALPGATVTIADAHGGTFTTTTDADGRWRYWLKAADGPFTVAANATDHAAMSPRQATLAAGAETRADIDLRATLPCLMTDPATLSATAPAGQTLNLPFQLMNGGAGATAWTLRAGGDPQALFPMPLSQTNGPDPEQDMYTACVYGSGITTDNVFLRVFPLAGRDDPSQIATISGVEFAIGLAESGTGSQPVTARVYRLRGDDLVMANLELLREKTIQVADGQLTRMTATFDSPLVVARDTVLVAAIHSPDGIRDGNKFFPGFNTLGQSADGFMVASTCGSDEPTPFSAIFPGLRGFSLLLELDIVGADPCHPRAAPASWIGATPAAGTLAADAATPLTAALTASGEAQQRGSLCIAPTGGKPTAVPVTLGTGAADTIFRNGFD
jgi:subtilisin family serine protease